jgi:hypothetical protein
VASPRRRPGPFTTRCAGRSWRAKTEEDRGGSKTAGAIRSLGNKIAEVVKTSGDGAQEVDPAVKAFSEVARPLARGYQIMRGDPQKRQEVRPIQIALPAPEIGQDLTDRRMAHIVTGGISSA